MTVFRQLLAAGALAALIAPPGSLRGADPVVPSYLPDAKKDVLQKYLTGRPKPDTFLPAKCKIEGGTVVQPDPKSYTEVKEYLASVEPHKDAGKADVYYFRPNPTKGEAGVTVRVTVDLATGKEDGDPIVLANYSAPLTKEERVAAIKLARAEVDEVKAMYAGGEMDVQVVALVNTVTTAAEGRKLGDRVVRLQIRKKGMKDVLSVIVNLTQETVLKSE